MNPDEFIKRLTYFEIGDSWAPRPPANDEEFKLLSVKLTGEIMNRLKTNQDFYWFVIEQFDRLLSANDSTHQVLRVLPLFEIEYAGRRSADSYVGSPNPGVEFVSEKVAPAFIDVFGEAGGYKMTAGVFIYFCQMNVELVRQLRLDYATHYHNNCVSEGHYRSADRWNDVIFAARKRPDALF